jgi:hypothetical protein
MVDRRLVLCLEGSPLCWGLTAGDIRKRILEYPDDDVDRLQVWTVPSSGSMAVAEEITARFAGEWSKEFDFGDGIEPSDYLAPFPAFVREHAHLHLTRAWHAALAPCGKPSIPELMQQLHQAEIQSEENPVIGKIDVLLQMAGNVAYNLKQRKEEPSAHEWARVGAWVDEAKKLVRTIEKSELTASGIRIPDGLLTLIDRLDGLNHDLIGLLGGGALGLLDLAVMGKPIIATDVASIRKRSSELASVWHELHDRRKEIEFVPWIADFLNLRTTVEHALRAPYQERERAKRHQRPEPEFKPLSIDEMWELANTLSIPSEFARR